MYCSQKRCKGTTIFEKIIKLSIKFSIFLWYFEKYE